jgi:choline dehydrogenase-like flavoprotein
VRKIETQVEQSVKLQEPGDWQRDDVVECDIAIIGSGMGGGSFAWAMRHSGKRILIIERGLSVPREWQNDDPRSVWMDRRYHNAEDWWDEVNGKQFEPGQHYFVGGNTKFYGACLPRFRESDFQEVETADGISPAWPFTYDDLEPYYLRAETLFGVHGSPNEDPTEPRRSGPFPFAPVPDDPPIAELRTSLASQGLSPSYMPMAVESGDRCVRCGFCDGYPCRYDGKNDAETVAVMPALEEPNVRIFTEAYAERLETTSDGQHCVALKVQHASRAITVRANQFVIAAGAANTAALLLRSASENHPHGLANSSDQVGRNYMMHNSTFMMAIDPRRQSGRSISFQKTLMFNDWYEAGPDTKHPLGNVQLLGKLFGETVKPARRTVPLPILRYLTNRSLDIYITTEDLPRSENRVTLRPNGQIAVAWKTTNMGPHRELVRRTGKVMRNAGYPLVLTERMQVDTNSHMCGTTIMGKDPSCSVLNEYCRTHDVDNLWVVDASTLPTSAAVNPALTVAAVALRAADHFPTAG